MTLFYSYRQNYDWLEWYIGSKPGGSQTGLTIEHEFARFTPDIPGNYDIVVESFSQESGLMEQRTFFYTVKGFPVIPKPSRVSSGEMVGDTLNDELDTLLPEGIDSAQIQMDSMDNVIHAEMEQKKDDTLIDANDSQDKTQIEGNFTIQVFSLPDKDLALGKLNLLNRNGFPGYVTEFVHPKTHTTWYRIRVGQYKSYESADSIAQLMEDKLSLNTWIDRLN